MSYVPPPREPGRRRETWYGVAVGIAACIGVPFLSLVLSQFLGFVRVGVLAPLAVLVVGGVLAARDGTRQWGSGLLMGFAISLVLGAGACVAVIVSLNNSMGG